MQPHARLQRQRRGPNRRVSPDWVQNKTSHERHGVEEMLVEATPHINKCCLEILRISRLNVNKSSRSFTIRPYRGKSHLKGAYLIANHLYRWLRPTHIVRDRPNCYRVRRYSTVKQLNPCFGRPYDILEPVRFRQ